MSRHKSKKTTASRNVRLADQIQKDLAQIIQREIPMTRAGMVTLTHVDLSADYAHAKIYFTVIGAEPTVAQEVLNERAGYLHSILFKLLHIHTVPTLKFYHDDQLLHGMEMDRLISRAVRDEPDQLEDAQNIPSIDDAEIKG